MNTLAKRTFVILIKWLMMGVVGATNLPTLALDVPHGPVVLTLSGKIDVQNQPPMALLDMAMLQALPQQTFTSRTPWDNHPVTFSGPRLRDVLALVKASGTQLRAVALNDYRVKLPASDADQFEVLVALRMNGQAIPVRTKGPLFMVYPFDSAPVLQSKLYYERSIWQLKAIEVER
jgi:hypothetical protein